MTLTQLQSILASPVINIAGLASKIGTSRRFMIAIRDGERNLTPKMAERISIAIKEIHELTALK
jgi:plasmid maintenance system antidote protein VapI